MVRVIFILQMQQNLQKNVTEKSGGKLTIVTHPGGSLFKGEKSLVSSK